MNTILSYFEIENDGNIGSNSKEVEYWLNTNILNLALNLILLT